MLLRQGVKAALPKTQKQTQGGLPNWGDKEIWSKWKKKNKTLEKELNKIEIANLSDAKFKSLVIRMLRELTEHSNNITEEMKVTLNEIKKSPQGTNSEQKEARIQINDLEHKEEINIQPEQKEETRIKNKQL